MTNLKQKILLLKNSKVKEIVDKRLKEFELKQKQNNDEWYSEMCFCILTANSRAQTAINIQNELGPKGFLEKNQKELEETISRNKHRFSGMKSRYLIESRKQKEIKSILTNLTIKSQEFLRNYLAENILGIGLKEASHFLRNVGFFELAILDRHILALLQEYKYISEIPKSLTKKEYFRIEKIFQNLAKELNMASAELDLYMWYMRTGEVLK
ncbi:MAG: N-glycosylase/DNA lyase [Candidatus Nanoarchaeia archaeon]|nr:N-glycosylase/DNA lyase [Candidatus Nanoarchaeia archaeon]